MSTVAGTMTLEQNRRLSDAMNRERSRLASFIRRRVPDARDAEDLLQDVFCELVEAYRLMQPIEQLSAWLFRVARNRIADLFRRRRTSAAPPMAVAEGDTDPEERWEDLLPSPAAGPEASLARAVLVEEIEAALLELPEEQRAVFVAHEIEGRSFREMSAALGVGVNTLLARKHYAVRFLRRRLDAIYRDFAQDFPQDRGSP
jgi:RNA polymerase sigma factor (sigma-70 family)